MNPNINCTPLPSNYDLYDSILRVVSFLDINTNLRCSLESDVLFNLLLNDHMMLTNFWNRDLVIKKEKMDAIIVRKQVRALRSLWMLIRSCRVRVGLS